MDISSKFAIFCGSAILVLTGDGGAVENISNSDDCNERGEGGRSVDVRGDARDGVRDEGRSGTVLNIAISSVIDGGGCGSSLAAGRGVNMISGWVAVETGRKVTSGPEPTQRKQDGKRQR